MRRLTLITAAGLALATAAPAQGAGGPVPPAQGGVGVSAPGGTANFVAVSGGADRTVVMRINRADGSVERSRSIAGSYGIPGVTYDGVNTGLSADQATLVVAQGANRFPMRTTKLQVLDGRTLRTRTHISLPGMVSVDAISPDGRWMYLVDYKNGALTEYDVRAYDLRKGELVRKPIVDPREPEEKLQGIPITRVQSPDGRWAYTLYTGDEPFIHALDTVGRTAVCIDVPQVAQDGGSAKLVLGDGTLQVRGAGGPLALVDLKSYKVTTARAASAVATATATAAATAAPTTHTDAGPPWALWMLPLAALAVLVVVARQRRARQSPTS